MNYCMYNAISLTPMKRGSICACHSLSTTPLQALKEQVIKSRLFINLIITASPIFMSVQTICKESFTLDLKK